MDKVGYLKLRPHCHRAAHTVNMYVFFFRSTELSKLKCQTVQFEKKKIAICPICECVCVSVWVSVHHFKS